MNDTVSELGIKSLSKKMLKIMKEVQFIKKNGFNEFHKYKYATESDVSAAFSKAMMENGVFMFSSILDRESIKYTTRGNKDAFLVSVKMQITFVDADSGESFTSIFYGDGSDADDKAIYKAITGAQKYALMKTFLVETGDDPERESATQGKTERSLPLVNKTAPRPEKISNKRFVMPFGKDKGRSFNELTEEALSRTRAWAEKTDAKKFENLIQNIDDFLDEGSAQQELDFNEGEDVPF